MRTLLAVVLLVGASRSQRLAIPDAAARAAAHEGLLAAIASITPDVDAIVALAGDSALTPAVRYQLLEHAERVARVRHDVAAGLRAADARAASFDVLPGVARDACLQQFEVHAAAPVQVLCGARLAEARQRLEGARAPFDSQLQAARRLATADHPRGLRALVDAEAATLASTRAAFERHAAAPADASLRGRYLALYRGQWESGLASLQHGDDRTGRIADGKLRAAAAAPADREALARAAEEWLSQSLRATEAIVQRNLRRRAMALLAPIAGVRAGLGDDTPVSWDGPEWRRAGALLERAEELAVATLPAAAHRLRFVEPSDGERMVVAGGEWSVAGGCLVGRNTGAATRATAPFAWRAIDCVTIRGGIRSAGTLNFRIAIGEFNALLNWEVADQNHFYFGEIATVTEPRALQANREHVIRVRQVGGLIAVSIDGAQVALGPGILAGSVSVYPALGSEITVRAIDVVGDVDLGVVVTGPTAKAR